MPSSDSRLQRSFLAKFPVELLLCLVFFVLAILSRNHLLDSEYAAFFFPLFALSFFLNGCAPRWLYFASFFLWIPAVFLCPEPPTLFVVLCNVLGVVLLTLGSRRMRGPEYGDHVYHIFSFVTVPCFATIVIFLLVGVIYTTVKWLFDLDGIDPDKLSLIWSYFWPFFLFMVLPVIFVWLYENIGTEEESNLSGLAKAFTILVMVYTVILYLYALRILISWDLPKGGVAYLVLSHLFCGLLCVLYGHRIESPFFQRFLKWFPVISVGPLALLWVGTLRRITDYGLTEERVLLLTLVILVTLFLVMLLFKKTRDFQCMVAILGLVVVFLAFVPWTTPKAISVRNQKHRLEKALPLVLQNKDALRTFDYSSIAADPKSVKACQTVNSALTYLRDSMPEEVFAQQYDSLDWFYFNEDFLLRVKLDK